MRATPASNFTDELLMNFDGQILRVATSWTGTRELGSFKGSLKDSFTSKRSGRTPEQLHLSSSATMRSVVAIVSCENRQPD
ncbi:unnamed protein product [Linum trigynum]|uniref:Uncharacterized protein n=1 Tax=Linum trigynum TaxID=586398 RepID=A0AAV2DY13_9ROSI